jgi:N6-adenosine-specific RNA methylase IME4
VGYLFIWVTNAKVELILDYLKVNNYKRVEFITWVKITDACTLRDAIGYYLRHMFEICIVGVKKENKDLLKNIS